MTAAEPRRVRRQRSASESLLSIALGLEAALVFFVTLTVFGLREIPAAVAFGAGAALIAIIVVTAMMLRHPWAVWIGWAIQALLIALGLVLTPMYFVGAGFAAIWVYCFVMGRRLDRRNSLAT